MYMISEFFSFNFFLILIIKLCIQIMYEGILLLIHSLLEGIILPIILQYYYLYIRLHSAIYERNSS